MQLYNAPFSRWFSCEQYVLVAGDIMGSDFSIHIALSDRGWILEKLARKLSDALPYVTYDEDINPDADIQYYMTYGMRKSRISPKEVAYFAHLEKDKNTQEAFYTAARNVDFCVCHSSPYEEKLRQAGIQNVVTISPGVDLEAFKPSIKIGVVGRTYHTGRKGEHLVAQVMDIPEIDWYFTGEGWPKPGLNLRDDQMAGFYNSMDYILVPSLYEGGPMSVVEALACGREVIAPPIGWVSDFPHIEYKTGDVDDLRRVLRDVVAKRRALRQSVINRGWNNWIEQHDKLFRSMGEGISRQVSRSVNVPNSRLVKKPALMLHGTEMSTDKGGPSVRVPKTALYLSRHGYDATIHTSMNFDQRGHDLYHIFNLWDPKTCRRTLEFAKMSGAPVVLSTIYLDLSERLVFNRQIPSIFKNWKSPDIIDGEYARIRAARMQTIGEVPQEPHPGYHSEIKQMIAMADHVICLSEFERQKLIQIGADMSRSTIVPNAVEPSIYRDADPELFADTFHIRDYVLCVGRLEFRKNQITLLHAMRETGLPLVVVGRDSNQEYKELLQSIAGPNATFTGGLPANSALLASAYAGARVFCLPSWSEGAPLVALEASAAGCSMVLSDRSGEQEYFGDRARYVDPADPASIRKAILEAYNSPLSEEQRSDLKEWTQNKFNWDAHIQATASVYEKVASETSSRKKTSAKPKFYIDLTSSANRSGPPSGIARVEERYALELKALLRDRVEFVLWNGHRQQFVRVSEGEFKSGRHRKLCGKEAPSHLFDSFNLHAAGRVEFEKNSILLVLGGAWIRNPRYVRSLCSVKFEKQLSLISFIHDVIQAKFKHWFPDAVGDEFEANCRLLLDASDHLLANSEATLQDIREFCIQHNLVPPPIDCVRFGDEITTDQASSEQPQFERVAPLINNGSFILCVSAIDIRKNHVLLYNVWERLIDQYGAAAPHLIMVGSKGWNIDSFLDSVSKNEKLKSRFHILNGINDATLDWLYRNCLFTVYPSLYEGWGLPVAEALNYGKITVAAKAGSVPEIAPDHTDLLDPMDFNAWYQTISAYTFNEHIRTQRETVVATYKPLSWRASAKTLLDVLEHVGNYRRPLADLRIGQLINLNIEGEKQISLDSIKFGGFSSSEERGTWTVGGMARLGFNLVGQTDRPVVLTLDGRAFTTPAFPSKDIEIVLQDRVVGRFTWTEKPTRALVHLAQEDVALLVKADGVFLHIRIKDPISPKALGISEDDRALGIMLFSMSFNPVDAMPVNSWIKPDEFPAATVAPPAIDPHGLALSIICPMTDEIMPQNKVIYLGVRYVVATENPLRSFEVFKISSSNGGRVTNIMVSPNRIETRYVPVDADLVHRGTVFLFSPQSIQGLSGMELIEFGIFTQIEGHSLLELHLGDKAYFEAPSVCTYTNKGTSFYPMLFAGWSWPEQEGVWTDGSVATLMMRLGDEETREREVLVHGVAAVSGSVGLSLNGGEIAWFDLIQGEMCFMAMPVPADARSSLNLSIHLSRILESPEHALIIDERDIGFKIASLEIIAAATPNVRDVSEQQTELREDQHI